MLAKGIVLESSSFKLLEPYSGCINETKAEDSQVFHSPKGQCMKQSLDSESGGWEGKQLNCTSRVRLESLQVNTLPMN